MSSDVQMLMMQARAAAAAGRMDQAERVWSEVHRLDPHNAPALYSLGVHALQRRDLERARDLLTRASNLNPADTMTRMTLAVVLRDLGDDVGEASAIQAALEVDPYFLPALLGRAAAFERQGRPADAVQVYRNTLSIAPDESGWPGYLADQMRHGRELVRASAKRLSAFIQARVGEKLSLLPDDRMARAHEMTSLLAGMTHPYPSHSNQLHIPRLPALPFYPRSDFAWVAGLEARTEEIRAEMEVVLSEDAEAFLPYIAYRPGDPVNQWRELNNSSRWSTFFLWRNGQPVHKNLARCPVTAEALAAVGMAAIGGLCPNAMFSVLAPRTRIPPHTGETNARLIVHLPLVVPDGCRYRVGFDQRQWTVGEALIFDDTIEHEAINDSDEMRVVLIFDVWNPFLSSAEQDIVTTAVQATREFHGVKAG